MSGTYTYDGNEQEPGTTNVTVEDGGNTIPSDEYTLSYRDNINAGMGMAVEYSPVALRAYTIVPLEAVPASINACSVPL